MQTIWNFIRVWFLVAEFFLKIHKQKKFVQRTIIPSLKPYQENGDGTISKFDFYKVGYYYGVGLPVVIGDGLAMLRNQALEEKERLALTYMASITCLYDDFFDVMGHSREELLEMTLQPEMFKPRNDKEKLFIEFTLKAIENIENKDSLSKSKMRIFEAQWESKAQGSKVTTWEKQKELTVEKGIASHIFFRDALNHAYNEKETKAIGLLGSLFQYGNDIFDLYKDYHEKDTETCVTIVNDINLVAGDFRKDVAETIRAIRDLPYPTQNKEKFIDYVKVVVAQCFFCLSRYQALQKKSGGVFKPDQYSRKELVCDMQNPINLIKTAWVYAKLKL